VSQEKAEEKPQRSRIYVDLEQLSSKQRGAVLGLIKDIGYAPEEIKEVVVQIPEGLAGGQAGEPRRRKRK
jgi:hypothetical protein